jgi:hypothetical protein
MIAHSQDTEDAKSPHTTKPITEEMASMSAHNEREIYRKTKDDYYSPHIMADAP